MGSQDSKDGGWGGGRDREEERMLTVTSQFVFRCLLVFPWLRPRDQEVKQNQDIS